MFASFHTQGITFIEQALRTLEERGYQDVRARIFGDRLKVNDRWSHFFQVRNDMGTVNDTDRRAKWQFCNTF